MSLFYTVLCCASSISLMCTRIDQSEWLTVSTFGLLYSWQSKYGDQLHISTDIASSSVVWDDENLPPEYSKFAMT